MQEDEAYFAYEVACYSGALQGFTQGFYENPKFTLNPKCMDANFTQDYVDLYVQVMVYPYPDLFQTFALAYRLMYTFDAYCNLKDVIFDMTEYIISNTMTIE